MAIEFCIVGGFLKIYKKAFVKEMLIKDGLLRTLLNCTFHGDFKKSHPALSDPDENNFITIDFSSITNVNIGDPYNGLLEELKSKYRDKIKGILACRGMYGLYTFEIDLNSDDDKIKYSL